MSSVPPIVKLPPELHRMIADQLDFPDNMNLRMVDSYSYKIIRPLSYEEGLEAEKSRFAMKNEMFVCNICLRLRYREKFVEAKILYGSSLQIMHEYEDRSRTLPVPYCIDCGYQQELPKCQLGDTFFNNPGHTKMSQIICNGCEEFPELSQRKRFSMCETCWQKSSAEWIHKLGDTNFRDCHMSKHWHHSLGCETCFRPFRDCHWTQKLNQWATGRGAEGCMMMVYARSRDQYFIEPQEQYEFTSECPPWEHYLARLYKQAAPKTLFPRVHVLSKAKSAVPIW